MTNITLIFLLMQVVDNQIHNSRFGLISAFIWGVIYSVNTPYTLDFVIHSIVGGALSFIGGVTLKFIWETVVKKITKKVD